MPFTPTNQLPSNPDVRIFFSGLMLLRPAQDSQTCEVFVNRSSPEHQLTIEVREKRTGRADLIKMRHVGPLPYALPPPGFPGDPSIHGMIFQVNRSPKGVKAFNGANPTDRDFNLAINLQGASFHNGAVGNLDMLGGRPSLLLNDAVFYTADKTDASLTINLKKNGVQLGALSPFASLIGANVYLDDGDSFSVQWIPQGMPERLELLKPTQQETQDGLSYEIYIINDPLYESDSLDIPIHDEFREYYKILPDVATQDQFRLEVIPPGQPGAPTFPHRGSTRTPCMSCILDP